MFRRSIAVKALPFALAAILALMGSGAVRVATAADGQEVKRHLVWDNTDFVWYCLGTPVNCMTGE